MYQVHAGDMVNHFITYYLYVIIGYFLLSTVHTLIHKIKLGSFSLNNYVSV